MGYLCREEGYLEQSEICFKNSLMYTKDTIFENIL